MASIADTCQNNKEMSVHFASFRRTMASTSYTDDCVDVDASGVPIKWYYFPLGTAKRIAFESITKIHMEPE